MYNKEKLIEKLKEIYGDIYDYSELVYNGYNKEVTIICKKHGKFTKKPAQLLQGYGCQKCRDEASKENARKKHFEQFLKKAKEIHGDKYDYSKVNYIDTHTYVTITCPIHGDFKQAPIQHVSKHHQSGCPLCGKEKSKLTQDEFLEKAKIKYGDKYNYSKVNYVNCTTPIKLICPEHGEFQRTPALFLNNCDCFQCKQDKKIKTYKEKIEKRNKEAFNDEYILDLTNVTDGKSSMEVICKKHGKTIMTPEHFLKVKYPCKKCREDFFESLKIYTYQYCYTIAKKYNNVYDFKYENPICYQKSKENGWFDDFVWLSKFKDDITEKIKRHVIYVYEFEDNHAYIGLTNDLKRRDTQHRQVRFYHNNTKKISDGVLDYSIENNIRIPDVKVLEEHLTRKDAQTAEQKWLNIYKENGWLILNKVKCGSLGSPVKTYITEEEIFEEAKKYKTMEEMRRNSRIFYNRMIRCGLKEKCFPNAKFVKNMSKPNNYTEKFLNDIKEKYPTKTLLRKYEYTIYRYLYNHNLLNTYYPDVS